MPFSTPSDGRFKFNVKEDVKGLAFILKLRPVTYQFDVNRFDGKQTSSGNTVIEASYTKATSIRRTGFIAQEVEETAVQTNFNFSGLNKPESAEDHYSLSYEAFVVPLVKAVQEQQAILGMQEKKLILQEREIKEQALMMACQQKLIEKMVKQINVFQNEIKMIKSQFK